MASPICTAPEALEVMDRVGWALCVESEETLAVWPLGRGRFVVEFQPDNFAVVDVPREEAEEELLFRPAGQPVYVCPACLGEPECSGCEGTGRATRMSWSYRAEEPYETDAGQCADCGGTGRCEVCS